MSRPWSSMVEAVIILDPSVTMFPNQMSVLVLVLVCSHKAVHRPRVCPASSSSILEIICSRWAAAITSCILAITELKDSIWRKTRTASMGRMGLHSPSKANLLSPMAVLIATIKHRHSSSCLELRVRVVIHNMALLTTKLPSPPAHRPAVMETCSNNMDPKRCHKDKCQEASNSSGTDKT